ncbi:MAG: DUF2478 domain-containing protein [Roseiarcus sp.]|jgi:nucleoside-triphosphatase THEP1
MTTSDAVQFTGQIAALQGAPGETIQTILSQFAEALKRDGFRVAGVVEVSQCGAEGACKHLAVRDLTSKAVIKFSQDLGAGSTACNLDPSGLAKACEAVERAIEEGADVVVLSKFGKLEAARGGLCDAFRAAILADLPIITTVSPLLADEWSQFAGPLSNKVPATMDALGAWWTAHGSVTN